jgi:hypothetical protein
MAARTNNTQVLANIKALEGHAVEAVKAIEVGYSDAARRFSPLPSVVGARRPRSLKRV